jgi:hypothetical protein
MALPGYVAFVNAAAKTGWVILIVAVSAPVADLVAMIIYTLRHGESDGLAGKVINENRPLAMLFGSHLFMGRSKLKILGSKNSYVTESLLDGTATNGQRMMVRGIIALYVSFFLVFVGVGLMLMKSLMVLVLVPIIPGFFVYNVAREAWHDYRKAKQRLAGRRP